MKELIVKLYEVTCNYIPEREGVDNHHFHRIITTPSEQFTTFFPGNNNNYSYREVLAQENVSEPEDSSDTDSSSDSDIDSEDEDDFIDPESAPEYERHSGPLPLYEN